MTYSDSLCHLSKTTIPSPWNFLEPALSRGIRRFGLSGTHPDDWRRQLDLANQLPECTFFHNFGIHPKWLLLNPELMKDYLDELLSQLPNCHGIGEIGLDYYDLEDPRIRMLQKDMFDQQIAIALEANKPIVLHIVKAHHHAQEILSPYRQKQLKGFVHGFTGSQQLADFYLDLGLHISLGPHSLRDPRQALIRSLPPQRLLLESSAPQVLGGGRLGSSTPLQLIRTATVVAKIRGVSPEELLELSHENLGHLYSS